MGFFEYSSRMGVWAGSPYTATLEHMIIFSHFSVFSSGFSVPMMLMLASWGFLLYVVIHVLFYLLVF